MPNAPADNGEESSEDRPEKCGAGPEPVAQESGLQSAVQLTALDRVLNDRPQQPLTERGLETPARG